MLFIVLLLTLLLALPAEAARRVAVLDFENQSGGRAKEEFSWIGLNVPETLAGKLSEVPGVQIIERAQWKKLVEEVRLQLSDLFDQKKAVKVGRFLGAQVMGLGSFAVFEKRINFNLRFVDVETGAVLGALNRVSPLDDRLFEAFATLALGAVEVLNRRVIGTEVASLPPEERLKVPEAVKEKIERPATKAFDAYALLGKGKEAYDRHRWDEAIGFLRAALSLDPDYAEAWWGLGLVLRQRGRWDEAEESWRRALSIYERRGDEKGRGGVLNNLGLVAEGRGRYDEAEGLFRESLAIKRRFGDEPGVAATLNNLGIIAERRRRYDEGERLYLESLAISRRIGNEPVVAVTLIGLGNIARKSGRPDEGERLYRESLAISRRIGNEPGVGMALNVLGNIAETRGRLDEAETLYQESLAIGRRIGAEPGVAATLNNLGVISARRGRLDEAERLWQECLAIRRRIGDEPGAGETLLNLAFLAGDRGSRTQAIRYARESLEIFRRIGHPLATRAEGLLRQLEGR